MVMVMVVVIAEQSERYARWYASWYGMAAQMACVCARTWEV